jgi:hypothetical protein
MAVVLNDGFYRWCRNELSSMIRTDLRFAIKLKIPAASCRESSTVRNAVIFMIRSLTPPQAAGNALAFAVQAAMVF